MVIKFSRKNLNHIFNHLNCNYYLATDDSATGEQTDEGTATDDGK